MVIDHINGRFMGGPLFMAIDHINGRFMAELAWKDATCGSRAHGALPRDPQGDPRFAEPGILPSRRHGPLV